MRLRFLTSTPQSIALGSGTFAGISALIRAVEAAGAGVELVTPRTRFPVLTAQRLWFNRRLDPRTQCDLTVGFDMDGYRVAGRSSKPHIASIKGVIADEARFESGLTKHLLGLQARCEAEHVRRADFVMTTSQYAAGRLQELYGIPCVHSVVPELIDLPSWRDCLRRYGTVPDRNRFTVLCVCRFYPRKRVRLLLEAAAALRSRVPLQVRIVGGGPQRSRLFESSRRLKLDGVVRWLGNCTQAQLAAEYSRADTFCLPSVQEGFGLVFLEAMAAGKPIVAARAAAVPEVVTEGLLVEPDDAKALADALARLAADPELRRELGQRGLQAVEQYDAPCVAARFLGEIKRLTEDCG